ncbi:MAG: FkbM family methyltransferase [Alphaproteobacteria bacterium]|nr:FkbM family methyltransferase [Alphaproteobacteria bacterium]
MAVKRPLAFLLASTDHGTMIINRNDFRMVDANSGYGVGYEILTNSSFDQGEVDLVLMLLRKRLQHFGTGVVAVDCGANIGVHTIEWARLMTEWGRVVSFEAQERIFYALAGNIALNNCMNASAKNWAVGDRCGTIGVPEPNYLSPASFGSLELKKKAGNEFIGQNIDYANTREIPLISIDSLRFPRLDFLKIDVEGMEEEVLAGASATIGAMKPMMLVENIKSNAEALNAFFTRSGYATFPVGLNTLAIHRLDPTFGELEVRDGVLYMR